MNKTIKKIIILMALVVIIVVLICFLNSEVVRLLLASLLGIALTSLFNIFKTNGYGLKLWWQTKIKNYNKDIRISFSYLFRIMVDGKYLLVRGRRLENQFQPVGGVYKFYSGAKPFLDEIQYNIDQRMDNKEDDDDLRLEIKGKHILKFLDWFKSMKDREYDPLREFREELLNTGILSKEDFNIIKYRKVSNHDIGVTYSRYNNCLEYVYADVFELEPNDRQREMLRNLEQDSHPDICWADSEEIKKLCAGGKDRNLGDNTPWILGEEN